MRLADYLIPQLPCYQRVSSPGYAGYVALDTRTDTCDYLTGLWRPHRRSDSRVYESQNLIFLMRSVAHCHQTLLYAFRFSYIADRLKHA